MAELVLDSGEKAVVADRATGGLEQLAGSRRRGVVHVIVLAARPVVAPERRPAVLVVAFVTL